MLLTQGRSEYPQRLGHLTLDQTLSFLLFECRNNTEIAEPPHGAIGQRLSTTNVYENNVPFVDWHGSKNFKDFLKNL